MTTPNSDRRSAHEIEDWFKQYIATLTNITVDEIGDEADFESFGIDSIQGVDMVTALETWLGLSEDIPLELVFEASSIADAAKQVSEALRDGIVES